jgi:hypothetical protein
LSLELLPSCLGTAKHGRAERASLLLYRIKRTSGSGNLFKDLVVFMKELAAWSKSLDFVRNLVMGENPFNEF